MFYSNRNRSVLCLLLLTLAALVFVLPSASPGIAQTEDEVFSVTVLTPESTVHYGGKDDASVATVNLPSTMGPELAQFQLVSLIVTFDETVDSDQLISVSGGQVVHQYNKVFQGASLLVAGEMVERVAALEGVTGVYLDELWQLTLDTSPEFIGATTAWRQLNGPENAGEGVVIGILDSGIWPEHPAFADPDPQGKPYPVVSGGPFACQFGSGVMGDEPFTCNNKLLGAYKFLDTYSAFVGLLPTEFDSARDDNGHGTHAATVAAGNSGVTANIFGANLGQISGIAPRAQVIAYKVCGHEGCFSSDIVAAVEQAIQDGVDVINFSINGGVNPYQDAVELAFLKAYENGIFVSAAAGNGGPGANTVEHRGPWTMTVAASTHSRTFASTLNLVAASGETLVLSGVSVTDGHSGPVVLAADYDGLASDDPQKGMCATSFPAGTWTSSEIVVCKRGLTTRIEKSFNVAAGGAGGMILYNAWPQSLAADNHFVPSIHIQNDAADALLHFITSNGEIMGTFTRGAAAAAQGDVVAHFSARGGDAQALGVSKPDIVAPGVQILAGNTPLPSTVEGGAPGQLFQTVNGTSTATPHIAGAAALLKQMRPDWTPGQIKSALMITAHRFLTNETGAPATPFDVGSGRADLARALSPGLSFSAPAQDFIEHKDDLWNVNYPSIYVPNMAGRITIQRVARNELLNQGAFWTTFIEGAGDLTIQVRRVIYVPANGETVINITIDARNVPLGEVRHATLRLTGLGKASGLVVRLPITIVRQEPDVTVEKSCDRDVLPHRRFDTTLGALCTLTITNKGFQEATVNLVNRMPPQLRLVRDSVVGAEQHLLRSFTFNGTLTAAGPPQINVSAGTSPFGFLSLAAYGIPPLVGVGDESIINFATPPYLYGGQSYDVIAMVSNGYMVVGGGIGSDITAVNQVFPDPVPPNNVLAPFWTDLNPGTGGALRSAFVISEDNTWMVFEWENVPNVLDGGLNSFQVWIGINGEEDIVFTYRDVTGGSGDLLTIGAENAFGNSGANFYANGAGTLPGAGVDVRVTTLPGSPGMSHVITYRILGQEPGQWVDCAEMASNVFQGLNIACFRGTVVATP